MNLTILNSRILKILGKTPEIDNFKEAADLIRHNRGKFFDMSSENIVPLTKSQIEAGTAVIEMLRLNDIDAAFSEFKKCFGKPDEYMTVSEFRLIEDMLALFISVLGKDILD